MPMLSNQHAGLTRNLAIEPVRVVSRRLLVHGPRNKRYTAAIAR
jgi:hypothetical protein